MSDDYTTITVKRSTRDALFYEQRPGDSYDDTLRRLLGMTDE